MGKKLLKYSGYIVFSILVVLSMLAMFPASCHYAASKDEGEPISGMQDVPISGSPWLIQNRIMGYSGPMGGGSGLSIRAKNTATGERVLILSLSDIQTPVEERFEAPDHLIITIPNRVDILEQHDAFANISVLYHFTPKDDPEERAAYQFWLHHPHDPKAVEWCMKNIVNKAFCQ